MRKNQMRRIRYFIPNSISHAPVTSLKCLKFPTIKIFENLEGNTICRPWHFIPYQHSHKKTECKSWKLRQKYWFPDKWHACFQSASSMQQSYWSFVLHGNMVRWPHHLERLKVHCGCSTCWLGIASVLLPNSQKCSVCSCVQCRLHQFGLLVGCRIPIHWLCSTAVSDIRRK